jgi:hypothetical protein
MRHRLFTLAATASLVLLIAIGVAWFYESALHRSASIRAGRTHFDGMGESTYTVQLVSGGIELDDAVDTLSPNAPAKDRADYFNWLLHGHSTFDWRRTTNNDGPSSVEGRKKRVFGFAVWSFDTWILPTASETLRELSILVPCWFLFCIAAILPILWWRARKRRLIATGNPCKACGYNLTGNLSGVCPECGTAVPGISPDAGREASR